MILTPQQIKNLAPAVYSTKHLESKLSGEYYHVNTAAVLKTLATAGWHPVSASQKRSRNGAFRPYAKHLVRLRRESQGKGDVYPELLVVNSHNGSSSYKLMAGVFVVACANGLVVAESTLAAVKFTHRESNKEKILSAAKQITEQIAPVIKKIDLMRNRKLTTDSQKRFAEAALKLKFPSGNAPLAPETLLVPRRESDARADLWAVFNRVQENLMAGGTQGRTATGRRFTSTPVRDINMQIKLNQKLWELAEFSLN